MPGMGFELGHMTNGSFSAQCCMRKRRRGWSEWRETVLQCDVLGGLKPRSGVGKAVLHDLVKTFISGTSILQRRNGGEKSQRETHH